MESSCQFITLNPRLKAIVSYAFVGMMTVEVVQKSESFPSALCGHELCGSGWSEMGCRFLLSGAHNESLVIGREESMSERAASVVGKAFAIWETNKGGHVLVKAPQCI